MLVTEGKPKHGGWQQSSEKYLTRETQVDRPSFTFFTA